MEGHRFTVQGQQTFAADSGDFNPMHMDPVAARRLISGQQVVHGVHVLMHILESWYRAGRGAPAETDCRFEQPVSVGEIVTFRIAAEGEAASAGVGDTVCTSVVMRAAAEPVSPWQVVGPAFEVGALAEPMDRPPETWCGQHIVLPLSLGNWTERFPQATRALGNEAMRALAGLSYFVGMVCPGLHSVFSSLRFQLTGDAGPLQLRVRRYDPRFRLFIIDFQGPLSGELRAFVRPPPQSQPTTRELLASVREGEFASVRALVLGGSRGLGELTAKLVAAGGGDVILTYASGSADAERVAADIASAGRGRCVFMRADVADQEYAALPIDGLITHVFYFVTPRIARKKSVAFDADQFAEFTRFYLTRFAELCEWLEARPQETGVTVYVPSSVFIAERPKGMTEYAMAKAAAELLADDLGRTLRRVRTVHTRLPRLATDQTSSILGLRLASNVDVLLPVVRQVCAQ